MCWKPVMQGVILADGGMAGRAQQCPLKSSCMTALLGYLDTVLAGSGGRFI